jgi:hypothetical protein
MEQTVQVRIDINVLGKNHCFYMIPPLFLHILTSEYIWSITLSTNKRKEKTD